MPQADFYLIDKPRFREQPLLLVCELARKAFNAQIPTLILTRTLDEAEAVDDLLWSFDPEAFIPHQIAGDDEDEVTAILIVPPGAQTADRPMLINLREECADGQFESVKEVVAANPDEREGSRKRWAEYRKRGFDVRKFDM
jgi:DNA polymerase-3 subunit chi